MLEHFRAVLVDSPFLAWMLNSSILVLGAVLLSTAVSVLGACSIATMQFKGRDTLLAVSTSLMAVPPVVMVVPLFVLYRRLGVVSTYHGAIEPNTTPCGLGLAEAMRRGASLLQLAPGLRLTGGIALRVFKSRTASSSS